MSTNILKRIVPSQVITLNSKTFGDIGFQLEDRLFLSRSLGKFVWFDIHA